MLCLTLTVLAAPLGVLKPVDQASQDPSFLAYRKQLQAAVKARSAAQLEPLVDARIGYSFGADEPGWKGFCKFYHPEKADAEMWSELARVLEHGGAFDKDHVFNAPYVSSNWPENLEPYQHGAIVAANVKALSKPDKKAPAVATLSYDLVETVQNTGDWVKIKLPKGGTGWVEGRYFQTPVGFRAFFEKKAGAWKMTTFIAGD